MPIHEGEDFISGLDNAYLIMPDGTRAEFSGLSNVTVVESEEENDKNRVVFTLLREASCSLDILQTNKQSRHTRKVFHSIINHAKRVNRRFYRLKEKIRRSRVQGKTEEYIDRQVVRSSYYIGYFKPLMDIRSEILEEDIAFETQP